MSTESERQFFDDSYASSARRSVWKYYALSKRNVVEYRERILAACADRTVLEYGCGQGSFSFELARAGARVIGIDISPVAIEKASARAREAGLAIEFHVMDAENLQLPPASVDLVCGTGIIHHLDVDRSMRELARVMRPGGKALFSEPLGHNPGMWLFRAATPKLRTADEHPLLRRDFAVMRRHFRRVDARYYTLLSFLSIPFLPTPWFHGVLTALDRADDRLFRAFPAAGWWAWYSVIELSEPAPAPR